MVMLDRLLLPHLYSLQLLTNHMSPFTTVSLTSTIPRTATLSTLIKLIIIKSCMRLRKRKLSSIKSKYSTVHTTKNIKMPRVHGALSMKRRIWKEDTTSTTHATDTAMELSNGLIQLIMTVKDSLSIANSSMSLLVIMICLNTTREQTRI